jgi:hypothetical protein
MTKKILSFICCLLSVYLMKAQVNILPQFTDNVMLKNQLWQLALTNSSINTYDHCYLQLSLQDKTTGVVVYHGKTMVFNIAAQQTKTISPNTIGPIEYTIFNTNYGVDATQNGLLPVGQFDACFQLLNTIGESSSVIGDICQSIQIDPIAPPTLINPIHNDTLENVLPLFQWNAPISFSNNLAFKYELKLVELYDNQSPENGIAENIPHTRINNITLPQYAYTSNNPTLQIDKKYAWQISAYLNNAFIANSEVWSFEFKNDSSQNTSTFIDYSTYAVMDRQMTQHSYVQSNPIKVLYNNFLADSTTNFVLHDLTDKSKNVVILANKVLVYGSNAIQIDNVSLGCIPNHMYELELINSRQERWFVQFVYKP